MFVKLTRTVTLFVLLLVAFAGRAAAQPTPMPASPPGPDNTSIDAIITALYDVISGPAGQARDWDRFMALFHPNARLIPTGRRQDGSNGSNVIDPAGYRERAGPQLEQGGFFEIEIARRTEQFGAIAHVWSTYETRRTEADPQPFMRGINSIQLFWDGQRWWVLSIFWSPEGPSQPLPACYLPAQAGAPPVPCTPPPAG